MSDKITISGLEIMTHIGVPDEERARAQRLEISVTFPVEQVKRAAQTDDLSHSIDYYQVSELIKNVAAQHPRKLIETLAEDIAACILENFPVKSVELEIRKFILPETRHVALRIKRKRKKSIHRRDAESTEFAQVS